MAADNSGAWAYAMKDRIVSKSNVVASGCWQWRGALTDSGYGRIIVGMRRTVAHRASWAAFRGPIPDGLTLDHLCRNRACVNPEHLEPVSLAVNILRGTSPAASNAQKTLCKRGHPLTTIARANGRRRRFCMTCEAARQRALYAMGRKP